MGATTSQESSMSGHSAMTEDSLTADTIALTQAMKERYVAEQRNNTYASPAFGSAGATTMDTSIQDALKSINAIREQEGMYSIQGYYVDGSPRNTFLRQNTTTGNWQVTFGDGWKDASNLENWKGVSHKNQEANDALKTALTKKNQ